MFPESVLPYFMHRLHMTTKALDVLIGEPIKIFKTQEKT